MGERGMMDVTTKTATVFKYVGYFMAACTLIGTLYGIFRGVYRTVDSVEKIQAQQTSVQTQQKVILDSVNALSNRVEGLTLTVEGVGENGILIGKYVQGVWRAFDYHVKNSAEVSKEDYAKMMSLLNSINIDTMQYRITVKKIEK